MSPQKLDHRLVDYDSKRAATDSTYARSVLSAPSFVAPSFLAVDPSFRAVLGISPRITLLEHRPDDQFAHEAGLYLRATDSVYFTANYHSSRPLALYSVSCSTHEVKQHTFPLVVNANGGCAYDGKILYCSQGDRTTPSALVLVDPLTEEATTLLDNFSGRGFNSLNDVVVHHATGDIWFTDPTYGHQQDFRPHPTLPSQVYRFDPATGRVAVVADGFVQCNGLCFSPDYSRMYVTDTGACQAHAGPGNGMNFDSRLPASIYVYDVEARKRLVNRRFFAFCDRGVPDGIKCDERGNVWSGCGDGLHCWNSDGDLIGKVLVGGTVANFNFAKGGIYMFAEHSLFFCEVEAKGALVEIECE